MPETDAKTAARRISTGADQQYWDALAAGRLTLQICAACGKPHWPAVWRCKECGSWEQAWRDAPMSGAVFTFTRNWHAFGGVEAIGTPFVTVVVQIDDIEGVRLTGLLEGDESDLAIGARVEGRAAVTEVWGDRIPAIRWRLARGAER